MRTTVLTERQIDELFGGQAHSPWAAELASFLVRARTAFLVEPDEEVAQRHIEAIARHSDELRAPGLVAVAPVTGGDKSNRRSPWVAPVLVRVAAALMVAAVALGGLSAGGLLPASIQNVVARVAKTFGISVDTSEETQSGSERDSVETGGTADPDETGYPSERGGSPYSDDQAPARQGDPSDEAGGRSGNGPPEGAGPPEGSNAPEGTGPPEGAPSEGQGPPDGTGPPEGSNAPEGTGPPEGAPSRGEGQPDGTGPPEGSNAPEGTGPPEDAGPPDDAGAPDDAGPPDNAGPPDDALVG